MQTTAVAYGGGSFPHPSRSREKRKAAACSASRVTWSRKIIYSARGGQRNLRRQQREATLRGLADPRRVMLLSLTGLSYQGPVKHSGPVTSYAADAMDHLEPLRRRIRSAPISDPPRLWKRLAVHAVGGLTEVGYADDSDLLLIVSSQG